MYPAGLTCRVGGRPDGGTDPTCPLWRDIATHNNNMSRILMEDGRLAVLLVSELAEKCVHCRDNKTGLEKSASVITGAVRKSRNSSGRTATGRTISCAKSDLNLALNPADDTNVMPTVPSKSCILANRNGSATRRRKWTRQKNREVMFVITTCCCHASSLLSENPCISCGVSEVLL